MKISVAMATYNGADYLKMQLQSLADQTLLPDELVITDDVSTDGTIAIIEDFAANAPFEVRYYSNPQNLGFRGNFNRAISLTQGDLVFLCDQDDVWFPEKIDTIARFAAEDVGTLVFMNDAALTDGKLNKTGLTKLGQIKSAGLSERAFVMGCCAAIRRELLDICLPIPDGFSSHDQWIMSFAHGLDRKRVIPTVLQLYRRHGGNVSVKLINSTRKISSLDVAVGKLKRVMADRATDPLGITLELDGLLLDGVERAIEKAGGELKARLEGYRERLLVEMRLIERRREIRQKALFVRIPLAAACWTSGDYEAGLGLRSFVRDVLG